MDALLSVLAFVFAAIGLIGCVVPVIPGVLLSYAGLLCAWGASYSQISASSLWIWLAITLLVTAADYFLPGWMTRRFGGSRAGAVGATIGVFIGIFIPPVGIVLGPFVGAVCGELLHDRDDFPKALRVGFGSFLAFIVGTGLKLATSLAMLFLIIADTWAPCREWVSGLL